MLSSNVPGIGTSYGLVGGNQIFIWHLAGDGFHFDLVWVPESGTQTSYDLGFFFDCFSKFESMEYTGMILLCALITIYGPGTPVVQSGTPLHVLFHSVIPLHQIQVPLRLHYIHCPCGRHYNMAVWHGRYMPGKPL